MQQIALQRVRASLVPHFGDAPAADVAADFVVSQWQQIERLLRPVVGQRGASALYSRCLHLVSARYAWLQALDETSLGTCDLKALRTALVERTFDEVANAGDLLLETLYGLLYHLMGEPLANRLLKDLGGPSVKPS